MRITSEFCWRKATECHRLGEMNAAAQEFFVKSRDSWIGIANRLAIVGDATVTHHEEAWDAIIAASRAGTPRL
jgi:hypothetical protein